MRGICLVEKGEVIKMKKDEVLKEIKGYFLVGTGMTSLFAAFFGPFIIQAVLLKGEPLSLKSPIETATGVILTGLFVSLYALALSLLGKLRQMQMNENKIS